MQPMRLIQNSEIIKEQIRKCSQLLENLNENDENNKSTKKQLDKEINQDYLTLDFIKQLKTFWNLNSKGKFLDS